MCCVPTSEGSTFHAEAGFADIHGLLNPEVPFDVSRRDGDVGWFGPTSQTWIVWSERSVHIAALRALWLQALHPLVLKAVIESPGFRDNPLVRIERTIKWISIVVFGASDEAGEACERLNQVHRRISTIDEGGRVRFASDPDLMLWVHVTLVESLWRVHERYGRTRVDGDALVREWNVVARALGCERSISGLEDLASLMGEYRSTLEGSERARATVTSVEETAVPRGAGMLLRGVREMAQSTLDPWARAMCGLGMKTGRDIRCRVALWALRKKPSRMIEAARARIGD